MFLGCTTCVIPGPISRPCRLLVLFPGISLHFSCCNKRPGSVYLLDPFYSNFPWTSFVGSTGNRVRIFLPISNCPGEAPVLSCGLVRYASNASDMPSPELFALFVNPFTVCTVRSATPFPCGYRTSEMMSHVRIHISLHSVLQYCMGPVVTYNWGPLSLINLSGMPCIENMSWHSAITALAP